MRPASPPADPLAQALTLATSLKQEAAAAFDAALDDLQAGRPVDRAALLARHPELAEPLAALDHLFLQATTLGDAAPAAGPQPLPQKIGPYCIERELGHGGFGIVYLAHDPDLDRRVALKVLHPDRLGQPEVLLRFQREAHAIARLRHPGIVGLFDYSRQGPPHYLVTELVEGVDPRQWCCQCRAGFEAVAGLLAEIADALQHAHDQGVCHRDLKPANLLIDAAGRPHVLDFGLARLDFLADGSSAPTSDGRILGSLPYMAPEQAAGNSHAADARSDIYSLGVILYELLTGRLPFDGPPHTILPRVIEEMPTPPRRLDPSIPRALEAVCCKMLAKRPEERYQSAADLARDLRAFQRGEPVRAHPPHLLSHVKRTLDRSHRDFRLHGWPLLALLLGVTIFAGCVVCNVWELVLPEGRRWLPMLATKLVQIAVMLVLAVRLRPVKERGLTPAERQIWTLVPAYYGAAAALAIVNQFLADPLPLPPLFAVLSGMGFAMLGATIWGWFYVWSLAFFLLAVPIALCAPYGLTLLGLGWLVCLAIGAIHLHWTR